jgi:hypothetical protein
VSCGVGLVGSVVGSVVGPVVGSVDGGVPGEVVPGVGRVEPDVPGDDDTGRPPPVVLARSGRGSGGAPTIAPGVDEDAATGTTGGATGARGWWSARRSRSATVGVIVGSTAAGATGADTGTPQGSGVSISAIVPGMPTVVDDWVIVWNTAVLRDAAPTSPTPMPAANRDRTPLRSDGVSHGVSDTGSINGGAPSRRGAPRRPEGARGGATWSNGAEV